MSEFMSCGPVIYRSDGIEPISFQEIQAYMQTMQIDLSPWHIEILRAMSRVYASEFNLANGRPKRPAPWSPRPTVESNKLIEAELRAMVAQIQPTPTAKRKERERKESKLGKIPKSQPSKPKPTEKPNSSKA